MTIELMEHQQTAIEELRNGDILWGGVGSGKSAAVLGYYMKKETPKDIYVITTAKKRDSLDWEKEAGNFGISTEREYSLAGKLNVDSWNNVDNYTDVKDAFFIFDEQRVVGNGAWVKSFLKIAEKNRWLLLSATPGDTWMDYAPVFIANGYFKNITDFKRNHVVYEPFLRYPKVSRYLGEQKLERLRNEVLVEMPYPTHTERFINYLDCGYDKEAFERVWKKRWNIFEDKPIRDVAELFRIMRKVVNSDYSRIETIQKLMGCHDKLIVFYNFNYELDMLRSMAFEFSWDPDVEMAEWNGHRKDRLPKSDRWLYLVQYTSGSEGWNCTETNAMVFYSMTYSYKNFEQAMGRIDRLDTPFKKLYYYVLMSNAFVDKAVKRALDEKKNFNERRYMSEMSESN